MRKVFFLPYIIAVVVGVIVWYVVECYDYFGLLAACRAGSIVIITLYTVISTFIKTEPSQKVWMSMKFHIGWGGLLLAFLLVIYAEVKGVSLIAEDKQDILDKVSTSENQLHVARHATTQKTIDYIAERNKRDLITEQKQLEFIKNKHDSTLLFARNLFKEVQRLDTLATYRTRKFAEYLDNRSESLLVDLGTEISSRMEKSEQATAKQNAQLIDTLAAHLVNRIEKSEQATAKQNAQLIDTFVAHLVNRMEKSEQATAKQNAQLIDTLAAHLAKQQEQTIKALIKFISVRDSLLSPPQGSENNSPP